MARRKKLNKRVAILLACMGALVIALVVTMLFSKGEGLLNSLFPQDPTALMEKGREHLKAGRYVEADKAFGAALQAGASNKSPKLPAMYTEVAEFNYEWAKDGNGLSQTEVNERFNGSVGLARKALLVDSRYVPAQEFIANVLWNYSRPRRGRDGVNWNFFIKDNSRSHLFNNG